MVQDWQNPGNIYNAWFVSFWFSNRMGILMEGSTIDVATIIIGAEGAFISLLIGIVGYFYVVNTKNQNNRMNKHERDMSEMSKFIMAQQEQIKLLAQKIEDTINLVDNNQKNDQERMKFMQDLILNRVNA